MTITELQKTETDEWVTTRRHHDDVTRTRKQEVTTGAGRGKSLFWLSGTKAVLLNCDSFDRTGIGERICIWSNQFFLSYYCTGHVCYNVVNKCYNIRSWSMSWNTKCLLWVSLIRTVCRVYQRCRVLDTWHHDTSQGDHKQWTTLCVPDSYYILKYTYSEASLLVDKALCIRIRSLNRLSGVFCIWYSS